MPVKVDPSDTLDAVRFRNALIQTFGDRRFTLRDLWRYQPGTRAWPYLWEGFPTEKRWPPAA